MFAFLRGCFSNLGGSEPITRICSYFYPLTSNFLSRVLMVFKVLISLEPTKDLVSKAFSGDELVREFEAERYRVKKAVGRLREEADRIADGVQPASRFDDVF